MNQNEKARIGIAKVIADLTYKGFVIFFPISEHSCIDLISVSERGECKRIQVKYRTSNRAGDISVPFSSVVNGKRVPMDISKIDVLAIYLPQLDKIVYYEQLDKSKKSLTRRLKSLK